MDVASETTRIRHNGKANRARAKRRGRPDAGYKPPSVADEFQAIGRAAMNSAHETVASLRDSATEYTEQGRDKVRQVERAIEQFIRERPLKTVLFAAGVGLLVGRFWMRR